MKNDVMVLNIVGMGLSDKEDILVWNWKGANGVITTKNSYEAIFDDLVIPSPKWRENPIWKWKFPLKVNWFLWLCVENKILTWNNLLKRGFCGLGIYVFLQGRR